MKGGEGLKKHYNLYYIFLEDKNNNLMSQERRQEIKKYLENFYKEIKPPWTEKPLNNKGKETT